MYNLAPRYSGGSPAAVDLRTFENIVKSEKAGYERYLTGVYGDEDKEKAERLGLEGICYITTERGGNMLVEDALTGKRYKVPLKYWGNMSGLHSGYWYNRTDRDQFELSAETNTTPYERNGKVYKAVVPCAWCLGKNAEHCKRCNGKGTEIMHVKTRSDEEVARARIEAVRPH